MDTIVISRHQGFVDHCVRIGLTSPDTPVVAHATSSDVWGKHVISSGLPLELAAVATTVTTIPLRLTPEMRGQELDADTVNQVAGDPVSFVVHVADTPCEILDSSRVIQNV